MMLVHYNKSAYLKIEASAGLKEPDNDIPPNLSL